VSSTLGLNEAFDWERTRAASEAAVESVLLGALGVNESPAMAK
jgi:hypothetical protein